MNILICGSSGFIGTHLVKLLADNGHEITGLDLNMPQTYAGLSDFYQGDILEKQDIRPALRGTDCVINLAARHSDFGITRREYFETNETGSRRLLECMTDARVDKYIFFSSVAVYGDHPEEADETTLPRPTSHYGDSKVAAENVTRQWARANTRRSVVIIRPTLVFGPGNTANMYSLIRQIDRGQFFHFGSGRAIKSLCYVENLTEATDFCLDRMAPGVATFNYVDKKDLEVNQMIDIISGSLNKKVPSVHLPLWLGLGIGRVFDLASKLTGRNLAVSSARVKKLTTPTRFAAGLIRDCGFLPRYSLKEGLQNMVDWYTNRLYGRPDLAEQFQKISQTLLDKDIVFDVPLMVQFPRPVEITEYMPSQPLAAVERIAK